LEHGKAACPAKQIPEETLLNLTAETLMTENFEEQAFLELVEHIEVPAANRLRFVYYDGHTHDYEWKDRSRAESWTDEMKQAARVKSLQLLEAQRFGSGEEAGNKN
jgi:hypothetical protein